MGVALAVSDSVLRCVMLEVTRMLNHLLYWYQDAASHGLTVTLSMVNAACQQCHNSIVRWSLVVVPFSTSSALKRHLVLVPLVLWFLAF